METLTFLNTDIEGSTALLRRVGDQAYAEILADHHRIIRERLAVHGGQENGTAGDSFFAVFTSPRSCVHATIEMQEALSTFAWPHGEHVRVRMGIHTGEASENATGYVGYEVHRAARISAIGHGGQILLSSASAVLVEDSLPNEVTVKSLGAHRLKDLGRPETIFQIVSPTLDTDFPPLRSLDNPELPNNLPTSLNQFVGREAELAEVKTLTNDSRLVTLTGAGGSGKTRLALQAAAELLDSSGDGVWYVELAPVNDAELVPTAVMSAIQLGHESDLLPTEILQRALKEQNVLLLIDNCEHLVDAVAELLEILMKNCPRVRFIATSREPLGVSGEEVYRVRSLSVPTNDVTTAEELASSDAALLFELRAHSQDKTFTINDENAPLVASICRRLDGIPLAIELAAARLSSMSIDDLHKRLDQRFRLLTGGSRNALPRQQTLGAMVAWSYDLLNDNERAVLRRLTVFVGSFSLSAAEKVGSSEAIDEWDIPDILGSLVNKSLVIADRVGNSLRYRLLETIRQYAADQLLQVGGELEMLDARNRHAQHYLDLCEQIAPNLEGHGQAEGFFQLDMDRGNIESTFNHFSDNADTANEIFRLAWAISHYAAARSYREGIDYLEAALHLTKGHTSIVRARGELVYVHAKAMNSIMDGIRPTEIDAEFENVLEAARSLGDEYLEGRALAAKCSVWNHLSIDQKASWGFGQRALEIAQQQGDLFGAAQATSFLATATFDAEVQKQYHEEALILYRQVGAVFHTALVLFWIAFVINEQNENAWQRRVMLLEESLAIAEKIDATFHSDMCFSHLGLWKTVLGQWDDAETMNRRSLASSIRIGRTAPFMSWVALNFARISLENANYQRAVQLMAWTLKICPDVEQPVGYRWAAEERGFVKTITEVGRAQLGDVEFDALFASGQRMNLEQAIILCKQPS